MDQFVITQRGWMFFFVAREPEVAPCTVMQGDTTLVGVVSLSNLQLGGSYDVFFFKRGLRYDPDGG